MWGELAGCSLRARDRVDRAIRLSAVLMDDPLLNLPGLCRFGRNVSPLSASKSSRYKTHSCKLYSLKRKEISMILERLVRSGGVWTRP